MVSPPFTVGGNLDDILFPLAVIVKNYFSVGGNYFLYFSIWCVILKNEVIRMYDYGPILIRLKNCKKASNLTNEELSSLSGVPLGTINKILSGDTQEPKLPAFMALASALNTSVDYLVYGRSDTRSPVLTASEVSLLDDFRDASDEIREEAAAMLHRSAERNRKDAPSSTSEAG
jgi:transcriptional regulator with XRE-family HTH domain